MDEQAISHPFPAAKKDTTKILFVFLALTFGITWGLTAGYMLFPEQVVAIFGEISMTNPLFLLSVYSPGFVGVALVLWQYGIKGLGTFFQRLTLWRAPILWWLFLIVGTPALFYVGAGIKGTISNPFPFSPWYQLFPAAALALFIGPIEEFGWRGLALPLLQRRFAPFWAGLILGIIWGIWHIPAFLIGGTPQSAWPFVPYFVGVISISVILTPMFNAARGSLLLAVLYHFQLNNPIWPDAQPYDTLFFAIAAIVIVFLNRHAMFQSGEGVSDVLVTRDKTIATK